MEIYHSRMAGKIDIHTHLFADTDCLLSLMDRQGIEKSVVLAMGMDNPAVLEYNQSICLKQVKNHPDRLALLVTFDLSRIDEDDYAARAREDGFPLLPIEQAAAAADVVMMLIPDEVAPVVFEGEIAPHLVAGDVVVFASGYNVAFKFIVHLRIKGFRLPSKYTANFDLLQGLSCHYFLWISVT